MLARGTRLAGYRVDGIIGQGGMGVVYEATQLSLERTVALKLLTAELSDDPSFRRRFRREGQLQAALDHPHIIPVYEAGESPHGLFLAMRLVNGPDLRHLIGRETLDERRAIRILGQVADALDTAHDAGLTHRDIKPQNVLVTDRDHAYLADFGLTKAPGIDSLTSTGRFVGTLNYTAPELIRGDGSSAASDVYAMGAMLYECLCGQVPFRRDSEAAVIYAHLQEAPPRPSATRPGLTPEIDDVVARAMSKEPEQRYPTAGRLALDAARALGLEGLTPELEERAAPTGPGGHPGRHRSAPSLGGDTTPTGATHTIGRDAKRVGRRVPAPALAVVGFAALAVIAVAFLAGRAAAPDDVAARAAGRTPPTRLLRSSRIALAVPATWRAAPDARVPGLRLAGRVAAASPASAGVTLTAGRAQAPNATLLPGELLARLRRPLRPPDRVEAGRLQALRYDRLRVRGVDGAVIVYAVPAGSGVATVACTAATGAPPSALAACGRAVTTLRVLSGRPFPLAPRAAYARRLKQAMRSLNRVRERSRDRLRFAADATLQAEAAEDLAGGYKAARRSMSGLRVSPEERAANAAVLAAFAGARDAHLRLAAAARAQDSAGYATAVRDVNGGEGVVASSLNGLRPLGYTAR